LERTVSDIHRYTSLPEPELRVTSLWPVAESVLSQCLQDLNSRGIQLKQRPSKDIPDVLADGKLLKVALANIVDNAIEAMPEGGNLEVAIVPEGDRICLYVKDTGVGIASQDLPHVFDPFFSSKPQASGLGLAIARWIIASHKGEIRINSSPLSGTEVWVCLPLARLVAPND